VVVVEPADNDAVELRAALAPPDRAGLVVEVVLSALVGMAATGGTAVVAVVLIGVAAPGATLVVDRALTG
jgi:hypothetical protein